MSFATELLAATKKATTPISRVREAMTPEIAALVTELNILARHFNVVELITPTNAAEEKQKFLASSIDTAEDPVFVYDQGKLQAAVHAASKVDPIRQKIASIRAHNEHEQFHLDLLWFRVEDAITTGRIAAAILSANDADTATLLVKKFGLPSQEWVERAQAEFVRLSDPATPVDHSHAPHILGFLAPEELSYLRGTTYKAEDISRAFKFASRHYQFEMGWQFPISNTAMACDVRSASFDYDTPSMVVPVTRECNGLKPLELIGHEVEEHMRQEENGNYLFAGQGHALMKGDETHLEGIAKISDIAFSAFWEGKVISAPTPWYIMAIDHARQGHGFADTARYLYDLVLQTGKSPKQAMTTAWTAAYRAKRGNCTNAPDFVQPKDAGYFTGYHMAREVTDIGLGQYLEMGCFSTEWILRIAEQYAVTPTDIPFPRRDAARRFYEHYIRIMM